MISRRQAIVNSVTRTAIPAGAALLGQHTALAQDPTTTPQGTNSGRRFNVMDFGAVADGVTDSTAAFQGAIDAMMAEDGGYLYFGGEFAISAPLVLRRTNLVGYGIQGDGRGTGITQLAENEPIFVLESDNSHSMTFAGFGVNWSTPPSDEFSSRFAFRLQGEGTLYNSSFSNVTMSQGHYFMWSDEMVVWGVAFENIQLSECTGGFYTLTGSAGQPNLRLESIYLGAQAMVGPLFNGRAINAELVAIEINQALLSPVIINDPSGGNYIVGLLGCEGGTWDMGDRELFSLSGSVMLASHIFLSGTTDQKLTLFSTDGRGYIEVDFLICAVSAGDSGGRVILGRIGGSTVSDPNSNRGEIAFHRVRSFGGLIDWNLTGPNRISPTDVDDTASADALSIGEWNDPSRICFRADEDAQILPSDARLNIVSAELSEDRSLTLPIGGLLFTGRVFEFVKTSTGSGSLKIKHQNGTEIVSLPPDTKGRVVLIWNRSLNNGPGFDTWLVTERLTWD